VAGKSRPASPIVKVAYGKKKEQKRMRDCDRPLGGGVPEGGQPRSGGVKEKIQGKHGWAGGISGKRSRSSNQRSSSRKTSNESKEENHGQKGACQYSARNVFSLDVAKEKQMV